MFMGLAAAIFVFGAQQKPTMADLDRLVSLYQELHLPIPPADAPLCDTGYRSGANSFTLQDCAYSIGKNKHGWYGTVRGIETDEQPEQPKPIACEATQFTSLEASDNSPEFNQSDAALAFAVIESQRGHRDFALSILNYWAATKPRFENSARGVGAIRDSLVNLALKHWFNEFLNLESNPAVIYAEVKNLTTRFDLTKAGLEEFIDNLDLTIRNRYSGSDRIEKLIDSLCDGKANGQDFKGHGVVFTKHDYDNVIAIAQEGYKAIPTLIQHFDDKRLIRKRFLREGTGPVQTKLFETVADASKAIVSQFAGHSGYGYPDNYLKTWWADAQKKSDNDNCWAVLSKKEQFLPEAPIRYAEVHFPNMLLKAVNLVIDEGRDTQLFDFFEAMERSTLDRKLIIDAAKRAGKSGNSQQVVAATHCLKRLDKDGEAAILLETLKKLPAHPTGKASFSPEVFVAKQVATNESPEVWAALLKATKRADLNLRLQLIKNSSYAQHTPKSKVLYVKYLAQFFDDDEYAPKPEKPFDDHHSGLEHRRVRYLALCQASYQLDLGQKFTDETPKSEWNALRDKILAKIKEGKF